MRLLLYAPMLQSFYHRSIDMHGYIPRSIEGIALFRCNFSGISYVSIQEEDKAMVLRLLS